jgi:hypothetical protein
MLQLLMWLDYPREGLFGRGGDYEFKPPFSLEICGGTLK